MWLIPVRNNLIGALPGDCAQMEPLFAEARSSPSGPAASPRAQFCGTRFRLTNCAINSDRAFTCNDMAVVTHVCSDAILIYRANCCSFFVHPPHPKSIRRRRFQICLHLGTIS